jgi:inorganic pyrophosphatase
MVKHIKDVSEMPEHFFNELKQYFEQYKVLENKVVEIDKFQSKEEAYQVILAAIKLYKERFNK